MIPETYARLLGTIDDARERLDAAQELAFQMELDDVARALREELDALVLLEQVLRHYEVSYGPKRRTADGHERSGRRRA